MTSYVLDACVLVAVLKGENGSGGMFVTADHHELESVANKKTINFIWFR